MNRDVYIHHILTNQNNKNTPYFISGCTNGKTLASVSGLNKIFLRMLGAGGAKFIGTGDDQRDLYTWYTPSKVKMDTGYYVAPGYNFTMQTVLVNQDKVAHDIWLTMEIEYIKGKAKADTRDLLISSGPCGGKQMSIKANNQGATVTSSGNYIYLEDGHIVYAKGHMHAGKQHHTTSTSDTYD